jgi:hypothetical protein
MTTRTIKNVVTILGVATQVAVAAAAAAGAEVSWKERTDYNQSLAAVMAGVSQVMSADASQLKNTGEYLEKLAALGQLRQQLRTAKMAGDMKAAENFYAKKKMSAEYRSAKQPKRMPLEKLQQLTRKNAPARLTAAEITPVSSRIRWPQLLCGERFAQTRTEIDRLFAERTPDNGGLGSRACDAIEKAVAQMKTLLAQQVRAVNPMEYLAAKKFLEGLILEARSPGKPNPELVASK